MPFNPKYPPPGATPSRRSEGSAACGTGGLGVPGARLRRKWMTIGGSIKMPRLDTPHPGTGLVAGEANCFFQINDPSSESTAYKVSSEPQYTMSLNPCALIRRPARSGSLKDRPAFDGCPSLIFQRNLKFEATLSGVRITPSFCQPLCPASAPVRLQSPLSSS